MCSGGEQNVRAGWTWMLAACNEPGECAHVDEQKRADRVRNLAQPRE